MLGLQMIDQTEFDKASGSTIHPDLTPEDETHYVAPWFVDYVKEWFLSNPRFGETPQDRYDLPVRGRPEDRHHASICASNAPPSARSGTC